MIKKWVVLFLILIFYISINVYSQNKDLNFIIEKLSNNVITFLKSNRQPSLSIISLKNSTQLTDDAIQKLYQFIVYRLELSQNIKFKDSMLSFVNGRGKFNLKRTRGIRFLMTLAFIRNKSKIGIGITLYSVNLDKLVFSKYLEWSPPSGEIDFLNIEEKKFADFGFDRIIEIDAKKNLLDLKTIIKNGENLFYFYYFDHIDIFRKNNSVLTKKSVIKLNLDKNSLPVIKREGQLLFFNHHEKDYMVIGNNTSENSQIYIYTDNEWKYLMHIDFLPFETFFSNNKMYFIGGRYDLGKNYFENKLIMKSINGTLNNSEQGYYKTINKFYSISFLKEGDKINSMYTVDLNYNFTNYGANFEIKSKDTYKSGYAFALSENIWIIKTAFTSEKDSLSFYKINEIEKKPKYIKHIKGEILLISNGNWNNKKGIWIYFKKKMNNYFVYKLQFWSKNE